MAPFSKKWSLHQTQGGSVQQWSAVSLSRRLETGDTTVVSGTVENAGGGNWSYECFSVAGHKYCYDDSPASIGFHQTAANGGPIHDGVQVRVTSIGDVVVRLDIGDGPP